MNHLKLLIGVAILAAGCSALPGLRVLTGEDTGQASIDRAVTGFELVMADKTGSSDPSLIAAADRIELASGNLDIIEIRRDEATDSFVVHMLLRPPGENTTNQEYNEIIRRAVELTWQGIIQESRGSDTLRIRVLTPDVIPTLDHGPSLVGFLAAEFIIAREDAIAYLSGPHSMSDFISLIAEGKLAFNTPSSLELYDGQPNHPMFMLSSVSGGEQ